MTLQAERFAGSSTDHVVQFYDGVQQLSESVARYLAAGIVAGGVTIVVATEEHRTAFMARLRIEGIDGAAAESRGDLIVLDAQDTMARFLVDERPEAGRFDAVIGALVREAGATGRAVRAYGEMVALLWDRGLVGAAIELEGLWNDLGRQVDFSLFCAYPASSVHQPVRAEAFNQVCRLHSAIVGVPDEAAQAFGVDTNGPSQARRFVIETLRRWGHGDMADDAALIVTELATNAVVHAGSPFTVTLTAHDGVVRVAVRDTSPAVPIARVADHLGSSGRGLHLVDALAAAWGTDLVGEEKVIWAELRR